MQSVVDGSILNAMRLRRQYTEQRAQEKLRVLRRLRRRYETNSLPKEISTEPSFMEQLFARVFDYATLLSHDAALYHLHAKPYIAKAGTKSGGRFPDFSLGYYSSGNERFLASAELKGPGAELDAPQSSSYGGLSAVQQAFEAVKGLASCYWIIVSNILELRLYRRIDLTHDNATPPPPIVVANLRDVWDHKDLARLCAHFDRAALVGTLTGANGESRSELMAALERKHPATPLAAKSDYVRAVLLFTPRMGEDLPMYLLERRLREAVAKSCERATFFAASSVAVRFELADGCIVAISDEQQDGHQCKVAMSGEGQIQLSASRKLNADRVLPASWLVNTVRLFVEIVDAIFDDLSESTQTGRVSPELREVAGVTLKVEPLLSENGIPTEGQTTSDVVGVDFAYTPILNDSETLVADVVSELAIYFRASNGGVGVDRGKVRNQGVLKYETAQADSSGSRLDAEASAEGSVP